MKLITLLLIAPLLACPAGAAETTLRNVVFILIDDLGHYGVSAYGSHKLGFDKGVFDDIPCTTPNIDKLANQGLRCDRAFAYPLCEPTRIALMSGKLNNRNLLEKKAQHGSDITFSDVFKRAGYVTGITGKWKQSRGTKEIPAQNYLTEFGWDEFCCFDLVKQGNRFYRPSIVTNGVAKTYDDGIDPATGRRWFGPDIINRFALDFIQRHKGKPFLLYYPMVLVHKEDEGNYHVPTPATDPKSAFDEFDDDFDNKLGNSSPDKKFFVDMIQYTDRLIGKVTDKLDSLGIREKTLVVIMGDNGTQKPFIHVLKDGTRYPGAKGSTTDHGMHVPLIFSQPGSVPAGKTYDGLVDLVDIYPTLCQAAGITPPNAKDIDGVDFWPQVIGKQHEHRDSIFTQYAEPVLDEKPPVVLNFAFDKHYKRYAPHRGFPRGRFFDIVADSQELAGDKTVKAPNFGIIYHSGLDLDKLTPEQQTAFDRLGKIIDANALVPVKSLKIGNGNITLSPGKSTPLAAAITPANATRNNLIWESSDPAIASIDKFGRVTAHKPGTARISVYSWQDAEPRANNGPVTYRRDGLSDSIAITSR